MRAIQVTKFGGPEVLVPIEWSRDRPELARSAGARVIGASRGRQKLDLARNLGAEVVVDDTELHWPKQVQELTRGKGAELVFDNVGGPVI